MAARAHISVGQEAETLAPFRLPPSALPVMVIVSSQLDRPTTWEEGLWAWGSLYVKQREPLP